MNRLDRLLGPGVIIAQDGQLAIDDAALSAQLHQPNPRKTERCYCPACRNRRERKPKRAAPTPLQPWQTRLVA